MPSPTREETLRTWAVDAGRRLVRAGDVLAARQSSSGPDQGNVPPWPGSDVLDFHGTLAAVWIWSRAQKLTSEDRFALNVAAGWSFVERAWSRFIPSALGPSASDEAPYDCAMVLRAALADRSPRGTARVDAQADKAARLLGVYLSDLDELGGREFKDPGFLVWSLADYARTVGERGLLASARRFVERAFGMKATPAFAAEPAVSGDGLFDFSCTTATRVLSVISAEGATPFVGAWLRERVATSAPRALVPRTLDENTWNACAAAALGRAYVVSTDPAFLDAHQSILGEVDRRATDGALGRQPGFPAESAATFYYALAVDALVKL
jgi:hypothetical protein